MNKKLIDLTGLQYGRLKVIGRDTVEIGSKPGKTGQYKWRCLCDCGNTCCIRSGELRYGKAISCGCFNKEKNTKHGHTTHTSKSKIYTTWHAMISRCQGKNPHPRYGGRGIGVCKRWEDFSNFLADMGYPPKGHTLERKDNDGPYAPWNCIWATRLVQNRNKRRPQPKKRKNNLGQGVTAHGKKFIASVSFEGEKRYLGVFITEQRALRARELYLRSRGISQGNPPHEP